MMINERAVHFKGAVANKIGRNNARNLRAFLRYIQSILIHGIMQRYRVCDATFILNEAPLRSTSAHGILISGYAHTVHSETRRDCVGGANFAVKSCDSFA